MHCAKSERARGLNARCPDPALLVVQSGSLVGRSVSRESERPEIAPLAIEYVAKHKPAPAPLAVSNC